MPPDPHPDPSALIEEQAEELRRLARGLLKDAEAAEDVAQEAQVRALNRPSLRHPIAWMRTVTRRLAWRRGRDRARRMARERQAARPEGMPSTAEMAERREVRQALLRALGALPEPYRSTVERRYFEG